jgi:hypothetical protein
VDFVSSICFLSYGLTQAAWIAPRIVVGTILEIGRFRFPGSERYPAQAEGSGFSFVRIRAQRALKGPDVRAGEDLRVFSSMEWYRYENAEEIRMNIISYVDPHYSEALPSEQLKPGAEVLVYLDHDPLPSGFPSDTVFQAFSGAYDRADRAEEILALLQEGPPGDFDREIRLRRGHRVRFPDGLEVVFLLHAHDQQEERVELGLAKDSGRGTISLTHHRDENQKETWETRLWQSHSVELKAMPDGEPVIVVRKAGAP